MGNAWLAATARRIIVLSILSILLLALGTSGYMLIEHYSFVEALYMTVITISTVGFTEVRPLDGPGRLFTILLILTGAGFIAFNIAYFTQLLLDSNLLELYRRRKLKKLLSQLKEHYIVCGYGQMGQIVVDELLRAGIPVVVIENDESLLPRFTEKGILHLIGDATDEGNLIDAGVQRAKGVVAVVGRDTENVFIVLTARDFNKDLLILARAGTPGTDKRLMKAGANRVVSPFAIGASLIAQNILRPTVTDFLELALSTEGMELSMEELRIPPGAPLVGKTLIDSGIRSRYNLIIVEIKRSDGTMVYNPAPRETLQAGDILIAIGPQENLTKFAQELLS